MMFAIYGRKIVQVAGGLSWGMVCAFCFGFVNLVWANMQQTCRSSLPLMMRIAETGTVHAGGSVRKSINAGRGQEFTGGFGNV
jgi:hypothetical protein